MAILKLTEIPNAQSGPERDQFELFAREFLHYAGFQILEHPSRGADAGADLIVEETRTGPGGESSVRWLVSCKHYAHSGKSVTPNDDTNIRDRLGYHRCAGFIAFYSTVASGGLKTFLEGLRPDFDLLMLDSELIERGLLEKPEGRGLAARFMPSSFQQWHRQSVGVELVASADPQRFRTSFFLRAPHRELKTGMKEASARNLPIFVVIYDAAHPQRSRLDYCLGYFMQFEITKRLVDDHFVVVLGPNSDPHLAALVPLDDPLEECLWVVLSQTGTMQRRESLYANPGEGLKRVREVIKMSD
jgi:hypothetical protein